MGKYVPDGYKGQWDFGPKDKNHTLEDAQNMQKYSESEQKWRDYHALYTVVFGELLDSGFDWGRNEYPCINEEVRLRLNKNIEDYYRFREICDCPPAKFKSFLLRRLNLIMPKYNEMYKVILADRFDLLETTQRYDKGRNVFSEYPQSQIQGSADYATNANDTESKGKTTGANTDLMMDFAARFQSVDMLIIKELEVCFYSTTSGFINAY